MAESGVTQLAKEWRAAGLASGDAVLVHSSLRRTLHRMSAAGRPITAADVLDSFLEAIGSKGTLLLPLFNFDFTKGTRFDMRTTPSQMGALTDAGRRHPKAVRTGHPIYSFAAIGAEAERFRGLENFSGYGSDSPFAILHSLAGRIAILDLPDVHSMTFYHYVEECAEVPYRFHKRFSGEYVDAAGSLSTRTFGLFVRRTDKGVVTDVDPMGELLWERGLYRGFRPGEGIGLRVIDATALYDATTAVIRDGKAAGLLYHIESQQGFG
jgi:aminoglycoside 3-N-acetyltransferase